MKHLLRIMLFILIIGAAFLTACSKKNEFVVKSMYCTTVRELNDDYVFLQDTYLFGEINGVEYTVPVKTAFSNQIKIKDFESEYESKNGQKLSYIHLVLENAEGEEWEQDVKVGDRFKVLGGPIPIFIIQK